MKKWQYVELSERLLSALAVAGARVEKQVRAARLAQFRAATADDWDVSGQIVCGLRSRARVVAALAGDVRDDLAALRRLPTDAGVPGAYEGALCRHARVYGALFGRDALVACGWRPLIGGGGTLRANTSTR